jgi:hypothetical protein
MLAMNFNFLVTIAFDYLRRYLQPKFEALAPFSDFLTVVFGFGEETVKLHTDNEPNNKAQMLALLENYAVTLASTLTVSLVKLIRNMNVRAKLAAIFADAAHQLNPPSMSAPAPNAATI